MVREGEFSCASSSVLPVSGCISFRPCGRPSPRRGSRIVKERSGTIVIVFKDGHRQTFNLSDIERVEFPAPAVVAERYRPVQSRGASARPLRGQVGMRRRQRRQRSISTLKESGEAMRSIGDVRGRWDYVNGEARVTWDDGAQDAIRKIGIALPEVRLPRGQIVYRSARQRDQRAADQPEANLRTAIHIRVPQGSARFCFCA